MPSLQTVPLGRLGLEQTPVAVLHVPTPWHWSSVGQMTGLLPTQTPLWQVSVWVQALPSLQGLPLATGEFTHCPDPLQVAV